MLLSTTLSLIAGYLFMERCMYNVTDFLDDHPGGDEVIINSAGKDATDDSEDVGHSDDARDQMKQYYVGEVDKSTLPSNKAARGGGGGATSSYGATGTQNNSGGFVKILQFLIPLLILGVAFAYRLLNNNNNNNNKEEEE